MSDKSIMPSANAPNNGTQPKSIYHITQEFLQLMYSIEENGGELSPEAEASLALNRENFNEKAESIANVIRHMKAEEQLLADEIDRLTERASRKQAARMRLEKRLTDASTLLEIPEVRGKYIDIFFRETKAVHIIDEAVIPRKYKVKKTEYNVLKSVIRKAIETGLKVRGAQLKTNKSLIIK